MNLKSKKIIARIFCTLLLVLSIFVYVYEPVNTIVTMNLYNLIINIFSVLIIWIASFKNNQTSLDKALMIFGLFYFFIGLYGIYILGNRDSTIVLFSIDIRQFSGIFYMIFGFILFAFGFLWRGEDFIYTKPKIF